MVSKRKNQMLIWADVEFKDRLLRIKANAFLNGHDFKNVGELTKAIINTQAFKDVEEEIIKKNHLKNIVKFDRSFK